VIRKCGEVSMARFIDLTTPNVQATNDLKSDPNRLLIVPPRAELDALQAIFRTAIEKWSAESPRNHELLKLAESEIAKVRSGD
jgi:hypothetical protein